MRPRAARRWIAVSEKLELDPAECYRVHDVQINKDDIHLYFTDGYLIFAKPVEGARDGRGLHRRRGSRRRRVLLLPPDRSERRSLAMYTGSPNLDEHIDAAVLLFGDDTYADLMQADHGERVQPAETGNGRDDGGAMDTVVRNLASSFEARLVLDLLTPRERQQGCFVAAVNGKEARQLRCGLRAASGRTNCCRESHVTEQPDVLRRVDQLRRRRLIARASARPRSPN